MNEFVAWLEATSASAAINEYVWLWPLCETLHFIGLAMLLGAVGTFDLRLMGFLKDIPIATVRKFMPWAVVGFAINLVTGIVFFVGVPSQYASNATFWAKIAFLVVAGVNAVVAERSLRTHAAEPGPGKNGLLVFKVTGMVSLVSWLGVTFCGRMLPFLGNAF